MPVTDPTNELLYTVDCVQDHEPEGYSLEDLFNSSNRLACGFSYTLFCFSSTLFHVLTAFQRWVSAHH